VVRRPLQPEMIEHGRGEVEMPDDVVYRGLEARRVGHPEDAPGDQRT